MANKIPSTSRSDGGLGSGKNSPQSSGNGAIGPRARAGQRHPNHQAGANHGVHGNAGGNHSPVNGRDPNLDRMGDSFGNLNNPGTRPFTGGPHGSADKSFSGLPDNGATPGQNGPHGRSQSPQSRLPDSDKNRPEQTGLPNAGRGNKGPNQNPGRGLRDFGKNLPKLARDAGGKVKSGFGKLAGGLAGGITAVGAKMGITVGHAAAMTIAHAVMAGGVTLGGFGAWYAYDNAQQVLYSDPVCSVANDGQDSYEGTSDATGAGGVADLSNPNAKKIFDYLVHNDGFTGAGAAGAVAVAQRESGFNPKALNPAGGVAGIFQWSGWSSTVNGTRIHAGGIIGNSESDLTLDKEFKLMDYEFKHGYSAAAKKVGVATDPGQAAMDWSTLYEGVNASDGQTKGSQITAWAQQAYSQFHGSKYHGDKNKLNSLLGGDNETVATANSDTAETANNQVCGTDNGNDDADTSDIVKTAKALEGYFTYANSRPVPLNVTKDHSNDVKAHDMASIDKHGTTDCSGYVWLVAKLAGYNPSWYAQTHSMTQAAEQGKGLKKIDADQTKAGDVAITDGSGDDHTVILLEKYHGKDTKIVNEGGSSNGPVHEETIGTAYGQYWNHYIFARIEKE